jgi:phospholipid/cholesterol/gamma-HCH transport system substrate-binding protein
MAKQENNNIKLGLFVLAGMAVLMLSLYFIGTQNNLFGGNFKLKTRFSNLSGLTEGDNVMFSGIQAGTVKSIDIVNDTTIEVVMAIDSKVKAYIHKNAVAAVGTEGLMGNKVINITPQKGTSNRVENGDMLEAKGMVDMDAIIQTLSKTNDNVSTISEVLKGTVLRIDTSDILKLVDDKEIGASIRLSLKNIYSATANANDITRNLNDVVARVKNGKGAAGALLTDTAMGNALKTAIVEVKSASDNADKMTIKLNSMVKNLNNELTNGKGTVSTLLTDTGMAGNLKQTMDNLKKGTDGFNQNMEALKHNFFFRGYFKSQEKKKEKAQEKATATNN